MTIRLFIQACLEAPLEAAHGINWDNRVMAASVVYAVQNLEIDSRTNGSHTVCNCFLLL